MASDFSQKRGLQGENPCDASIMVSVLCVLVFLTKRNGSTAEPGGEAR